MVLRYTTVQKYGSVRCYFKEINTFIQQEYIKLIKSDTKDIYNFTKGFYFIEMLFFWNFY